MYKNEQFGKPMNDYPQIQLIQFGTRLKQERERLQLSLHDFAALGEVNRVTQMRYEAEVNFPTIEYMYKIGQQGVDTCFIETGRRASDLLSSTDFESLSKAIGLIDELLTLHNFKPSDEFRGRVVLKIYRQIRKFGVKKVKPTLEELLNVGSEQ
jgi:transcriptional regulator with XRE-family HTH domain